MATKFCPNCGAKLDPGARFCGACGATIEQTPEPQPAQQQPILQVNEQALKQSVQQAGTEFRQGLRDLDTAVDQSGWRSLVHKIADFYGGLPLMHWVIENLYIYDGRINRWPFFVRSMLLCLIFLAYLVAIGIVCGIVNIASEDLAVLVGAILCIAAYIPTFVGGILLVRARLHDMNVTGWLYLINLIPYINAVFGLIVLFCPGTKGPNKYGADPLAGMH